jgi:hypothetical protein
MAKAIAMVYLSPLAVYKTVVEDDHLLPVRRFSETFCKSHLFEKTQVNRVGYRSAGQEY